MHGRRGNAAGAPLSTSTADMLAEERGSLQLIVETLNATQGHCLARSRLGKRDIRSGMPPEGSGGVTATEAEVVELFGMLPLVLQSAIAPGILQLKEQHRCSTVFDGVARPPPLSRQITLYHLLFDPLLPTSSPSSGESDVLECIARVLMRGSCLSSMETSFLGQARTRPVAAMERGRTVIGESITLAALRSLGDILRLCLDTEIAGEGMRSLSPNSRVSVPPCGGQSTDCGNNAGCETHAMLRDALQCALCNLGLVEHLWRSLLFQPITDVQRVETVHILRDVSRSGVVQLPAIIARTQQSIAPAVWGERVAECILSDPAPAVREGLAAALHEGFCSILVSTDGRNGRNYVHWRRWLTNNCIRHLLGVMATEAHFSVLQPTLSTLLLALEHEHEHEQLESAGRHRQSNRRSAGCIDLVGVVEVCSATIMHLFTCPDAVNSQRSGGEDDRKNINACHMQLRRHRLLALGAVRLLRLALRGVDVLLENAGNGGKSRWSDGAEKAVEEASLLLRTCVERQVMSAVLKCMERRPNGCKNSFASSTMRAEMVRFVRDLMERASPPLFFLAGRLLPYMPMMLQMILDAGGNSPDNVQEDDSVDDLLPRSQLHAAVCNDGVEMASLLAVVLLHSPLMRGRLVEIMAALQCTPEHQGVLFDVMERVALSLPAHAVRDLLLIDAAGTLLNDPNRLRWVEGQLQQESLGHILKQQEARCTMRGVLDAATAEARWFALQRQRQHFSLRHIYAARALVWFVLRSLRKSGTAKEVTGVVDGRGGSDDKDVAGGSSVSPIQRSDGASTECSFPTAIASPGNCRIGTSDVLMSPHCTPQGAHCVQGNVDEDVLGASGDDVQWVHRKFDAHSPLFSEKQDDGQRGNDLAFAVSSRVSQNAEDVFDRVVRRQLKTVAAEEWVYHAALELFAALASRYYRHLLTPQAALEYLQRQQRQLVLTAHQRKHGPLFGGGNRGGNNTMLRLWTARDVQREDLFFFALPVPEITEAALLSLVQQARRHQEGLRRLLLITPHTPRGRRWFLEDAAINIMGRLIALLQVLLQHIQCEGEPAVREALLCMPAVFGEEGREEEDDDDDDDDPVLQQRKQGGTLGRSLSGNVMLRELHCGTLLEMVKFVVQCFSQSSGPAAEMRALLGMN